MARPFSSPSRQRRAPTNRDSHSAGCALAENLTDTGAANPRLARHSPVPGTPFRRTLRLSAPPAWHRQLSSMRLAAATSASAPSPTTDTSREHTHVLGMYFHPGATTPVLRMSFRASPAYRSLTVETDIENQRYEFQQATGLGAKLIGIFILACAIGAVFSGIGIHNVAQMHKGQVLA
jgi:hypothetical protein